MGRSTLEEGELIARHHRGLTGETYMSFCAKGNPEEVNVIFLCNSEDGDSERYMRHTPIPEGVKVIDLSPDFRSPEDEESPWVYAVPELNRKRSCAEPCVRPSPVRSPT